MQKRILAIALVVAGSAVGLAIALGGRALVADEPIAGGNAVADYAYGDIFRPSEDGILQVELIPGANEFINSDGFYGREYDLVAPEGTWRVVGLGDSVAMYYSAEQLNHLSILERELPEAVGGPVEVLNLGVASYETRNQVRSLVTKGLKYSPDFVIVTYCINDGISFVDVGTRLGLEGQMGERPADDAIATHSAIRDAIAADDSLDWEGVFQEHIQPNRNWNYSVAAFEDLAELQEEHGFGLLVVLFPAFLELDDYYLAPANRAVEALGAKLGFDVLDLTPVFAAEGNGPEFRTSDFDSIHPNSHGYAIAANEIERWFGENRPWDSPR